MWHKSWDEFLRNHRDRIAAHDKVTTIARKGVRVFPPESKRYNAFGYFSPEKTKVVIVGQDPYHGLGQANGLSFSVGPDVKIPPSLRNIFKELLDSNAAQILSDGDLSRWAAQGVLLLNTVLSVEEGRAHSHAHIGWDKFTASVMNYLNKQYQPIVFLLWGSHAQKYRSSITGSQHKVLTSAHPSPFSAYRGFLGNHHFLKANEYLIGQGITPIDWNLPGSQVNLFE